MKKKINNHNCHRKQLYRQKILTFNSFSALHFCYLNRNADYVWLEVVIKCFLRLRFRWQNFNGWNCYYFFLIFKSFAAFGGICSIRQRTLAQFIKYNVLIIIIRNKFKTIEPMHYKTGNGTTLLDACLDARKRVQLMVQLYALNWPLAGIRKVEIESEPSMERGREMRENKSNGKEPQRINRIKLIVV